MVKADLDSYGASFKRSRGPGPLALAARADLLAGVVLLHTHHTKLGPVLRRLSVDQTQRLPRRLAYALNLNFAELGALATWPALVARLIVAQSCLALSPKSAGTGTCTAAT